MQEDSNLGQRLVCPALLKQPARLWPGTAGSKPVSSLRGRGLDSERERHKHRPGAVTPSQNMASSETKLSWLKRLKTGELGSPGKTGLTVEAESATPRLG